MLKTKPLFGGFSSYFEILIKNVLNIESKYI